MIVQLGVSILSEWLFESFTRFYRIFAFFFKFLLEIFIHSWFESFGYVRGFSQK